MSEPDSESWIEGCARYLIEQTRYLQLYERPTLADLDVHPDSSRAFHDYEALKIEIDSATDEIQRVYSRLKRLRHHFNTGEMEPFLSISNPINHATTNIAKASAELAIASARLSSDHPPRTRALTLQRSALRLAYANLHKSNPRGVRKAAKKIMLLAGIPEPSERALSAWLKEEVASSAT